MFSYYYLPFSFALNNVISQELIIGEERVEPGIVFIFEGAIKDTVHPESTNLSEDETNVHGKQESIGMPQIFHRVLYPTDLYHI